VMRLHGAPGVSAVAASSSGPMNGYGVTSVFLPGSDSAVKAFGKFPTYNVVSSDFFKATGLRIVAGRAFESSDRVGAIPVTIVSETMARAFWPGESPLGKCIVAKKAGEPCMQVVGVAADAHRGEIIEEPSAQFYMPLAQQPGAVVGSLVLRVDPSRYAAVATAVRVELSRIMPDAGDYTVRSMAQVLEPQLRPWRMGAILFSALGLLALLVASIGTYGVMAYSMTQRTHELGVRLALGAQTGDVLNLVLGEGMRVVVIGVVIGVLASLALGRLVSSLLFGVVPNDPSVLILSVVTLATLASVACLIPGWRAARVDPLTALRSD
jgi:putative ABC transport system permease protein